MKHVPAVVLILLSLQDGRLRYIVKNKLVYRKITTIAKKYNGYKYLQCCVYIFTRMQRLRLLKCRYEDGLPRLHFLEKHV